jgi:beta-lactamase regulating signal transducer with metallopeptidase domain
MNHLLHSLSLVSATAAGALLSAVWQGAVLCACVVLCLRLLPGLSAAVRSVVWLNVFVLLLLLHIVPVFTPRQTVLASRETPTVHLDLRWSLAIAALWLALALWRATQLALGAIHLSRLARRAVPIATDADVQKLLADVPGARAVELCTSEGVARPSVLGFFRPRILVPPALTEALSPQEMQQVVLHEMEHLRRGDDWTNLLQKIGLVLFPLNPVLLWVERRLCTERELACDDRVVRSSAGRKAYALCLAHLAEYSILRRSFSLVLGAWERRPELVQRVHRILRQPVRTMGRRPAILATGGLLAGALACAVALSHSPQFVSFTPANPAAHAQSVVAPLDLHEVSRALGGTPQLLKATMPVQSLQPVIRQKAIQPTVLKRVQHRHPAACSAASVTPAPEPFPTLDQRAMVVLTEWTAYQMRPRVVLAISEDRRVPPAVVIPARYAIVPTPNGWLIIQI